ncbi:hypothetical protein [Marinactinospora rubrisoli]|uniref:Uncharacterized protein n=1 Tax=Marinactinospora rubrisoli TaxID=2715399 RepID=A0ABW2KEF7_9ACTN
MACQRTHATDGLRGTIRSRSEEARRLVAAVMASCKLCRWEGTHAAAADLSPSGVLAELYTCAAEQSVMTSLVEGRRLPAGPFPLSEIRGSGGVICWPPTPPTWSLCRVTVEGDRIRVDLGRVLAHLADLTVQDRARVADDCLDTLVGAEFYPAERIEGVRARHLAALQRA